MRISKPKGWIFWPQEQKDEWWEEIQKERQRFSDEVKDRMKHGKTENQALPF